MGIDYNCYLGPYLQCKQEKVTGYINVNGCTNPACTVYSKHSNQKFCGHCGAVIGKVQVPNEVEKVDTWEVQEAIDEDLTAQKWRGYDVWIMNKGWTRKLHYDPKYEEAMVEVKDTVKELEQFKKDFAKQIETIEKAYGAVEFKWGMILWMN